MVEIEWRYIKNSKFYQVNNLGEIRTVGGTIIRKDGKPYRIRDKKLTPHRLKSGYLIFDFKTDINKKLLLHRVVLETFSPTEDMENLQVNHIDGNKANNNLNNLEWSTRKENMQHAMMLGLFNPQNRNNEKHPMCKLSNEQVKEIRELLKLKIYTQHQIAKDYNVSDCTISEIKTGRKRKIN